MSKSDPRYRAIHKAGDAIEPRMAKALRLSMARLRQRMPMDKLRRAMRDGDVVAAEAIIAGLDVEDALTPVAAIVADAVLRGGRIAGEEL